MRLEWLLLPAVGVILALAAAPSPARADCVSDCQASTYCELDMNASGECGRRLNDCYLSQCDNQQQQQRAGAPLRGDRLWGGEHGLRLFL